MWFGSYFGICGYDGQKFEKLNLPFAQQNKYVNFLKPAGEKLYAGFLFGGGLFEIDHQKNIPHFIKSNAAANEFTCMHANTDGTLFLCNTMNQIYLFRKDSFIYMTTLPQRATAIERDRWNNLWIATEWELFF